MPRKPKTITPLRVLREATGMSQRRFAALVGMGLQNYSKVERGSPLTREKALQISVVTGAMPDSLRSPSKLPAVFGTDRLYTTQDYAAFKSGKSAMRPSYSPPRGEREKHLAGWIEILLEAADKRGMAEQVFAEICDGLTRIRREFGLERETDAVLKSRAQNRILSLPVGVLRGNQTLARLFKFKPRPNEYDDDVREFHSEQFQPWEPISTPPQPAPRSSEKHHPD